MRLLNLRRVGPKWIAWMSIAIVVSLLGSSATALALGVQGTGPIQSQTLSSGALEAGRGAPSVAQQVQPPLSPPSVQDTIVLFNDSVVSGNFAAQWGSEPVTAAADPTSGYLFVADQNPTQLSVLAVVPSLGIEVVGAIPIPGEPTGLAYDSADGSIYVTDSTSGTVLGINGTNLSVDVTIPVGSAPAGIVFDSHNQDLYVANSGSNNVTVINGTTNVTIGSGIPVGVSGAGSPMAMAFDNGTHEIFVADSTWANHSSMPVEVINDTNNSVLATVYVGDVPAALAYDPYDNAVYVANELSDNLTAISDATNSVIGNYSGFDQPDGAAYLPLQHEIDVANSGSNNVSSFYPPWGYSVYNTTVGRVPAGMVYAPLYGEGWPIALNYGTANVSFLDSGSGAVSYTVRLAQNPDGIAYNAFSNTLFTANYLYSGTVNIINDTMNKFPTAGTEVGKFPVGVTYDTYNADIYVANSGSNTVSVISGFNNSDFSTIPVGGEPRGITYDPTDAEIWVTNYGSDNVSVISGATDTVVGTVALPANSTPQGIAYDSATGFIYVSEAGLDQVALINASSESFAGSLPAGDDGTSVVYDSTDALVYVANELSNNLTVYSQTTASNAHVVANISVAGMPYGLAYDPTTDEVFVSQFSNSQVSVIQPATESVQATVDVGAQPGAMAVDTGHSTLYVDNFLQGTTSVVTIPIGNVTPTQEFVESGLPSGATWYVNITGLPSLSATVNGGAGSTIVASLATGTYDFTAATASSSWTTTAGGEFTVGATGNPPIPVDFLAVTYPVFANETGLPVGATWYFNVSGPELAAILVTNGGGNTTQFDLQNGSYSWTIATNWANYTTTTPAGNFQVRGASQAVAATFRPTVAGQYLVTFVESTLPAGVTWFVNATGEPSLSATVSGSANSSVSITLGNGTYEYTGATNSAAWTWNDSSSGTSFQVSGAPRTVGLQFSQVPVREKYAVTFSETGLPSGDRFTVLVDGQNLTESAPSNLVIQLSNGTYAFTVANDPPYDANQTSGSVVVQGHTVTVAIAFSEPNSTPSPSGSSSAFPWTWIIVGVVVVVVLLVLFFLLAGRRRKKEEPPNGTTDPASGTLPPSGPGAGPG